MAPLCQCPLLGLWVIGHTSLDTSSFWFTLESHTHQMPPAPEDLEHRVKVCRIGQIQGADLELQRGPGCSHHFEGQRRKATLESTCSMNE